VGCYRGQVAHAAATICSPAARGRRPPKVNFPVLVCGVNSAFHLHQSFGDSHADGSGPVVLFIEFTAVKRRSRADSECSSAFHRVPC
jgi:hypothetical protein